MSKPTVFKIRKLKRKSDGSRPKRHAGVRYRWIGPNAVEIEHLLAPRMKALPQVEGEGDE